MHEDLLTLGEIQAILEEAKKPIWSNPNLMGIGDKKTSIFKISIPTGLILVKGNKDTGLDHIEHRHRFGRQVWEANEDKLNKASEIRYGVAPIDYIQIAESIYRPENLLKQTPEFDLYQGVHLYKNGDPADFRLLTYSGIGIIHTLYPLKSDNPRKRMFPYRQGGTSWQHSVMRRVHMYTIPYSNKVGDIIFKIIIRGLDRYPIERIYVEVNEGNAIPMQTIFIKEFNLNRPIEHGVFRKIMIEDGNKFEIEETALQVIKGKFVPAEEETLHVVQGRSPDSFPTFFSW